MSNSQRHTTPACKMQDRHSLLIASAASMHLRQKWWPQVVVAVALPASSLKQIGHSGGMSYWGATCAYASSGCPPPRTQRGSRGICGPDASRAPCAHGSSGGPGARTPRGSAGTRCHGASRAPRARAHMPRQVARLVERSGTVDARMWPGIGRSALPVRGGTLLNCCRHLICWLEICREAVWSRCVRGRGQRPLVLCRLLHTALVL